MDNHVSQRQTLHLSDRASLSVSGTEDVVSFDENSVCLRTVAGELTVDGSSLHIISLNGDEKGNILIEGKIDGLFFADTKQEKTGFFGRKR